MTVLSTAPTYYPDTDEVVLHVPCELDGATLPRTRAELDEVLGQRPARVVVDLTGCPFLDAAALGVLLEAHRTASRYGGELELRGCSARVLRLLSLTGLGRVFHTTAA